MGKFKKLLHEESEFFKKNLKDFLLKYPNRVLLIHGSEVYGDFSTENDAIAEGVRRFGSGPFLVRRSGEDELVATIPSFTLERS